jgi:membrane-bound metal-dependent hydrolase YbcI (DUF457 family)
MKRTPEPVPVVALAVGTQLPDLIDKPAAYWFGLFAEGRAIGHSLLFVVLLCVVVGSLAARYDRTPVAIAFGVGLFSHPFADAIPIVKSGRFDELSYLLWPVLRSPDYSTQSFAPHVTHWTSQATAFSPSVLLIQWWSNFFVFQSWLTLFAVGLWIVDGAPGLRFGLEGLRTMIHARGSSHETESR